MTATTQRGLGLAFMVAAALCAILNLKRVADLNMVSVPATLMIVGIALIVRAKKKRQNNS